MFNRAMQPQAGRHPNRGLGSAATLSVAVAAAIALAGCGPQVAKSSTTGQDPNVLAAPASNAKGTVTIWDRSGDLYKVFGASIKAFNAKYPNIKVNHQAVDIDAKLQNTLTTGTDVPDGVFLDDSLVAGYAAKGQLWNLSGLLKPYLPQIAKQKVDVASVKGGIYGVPFDTDPGLLYYNAKVLQKDGVDPSKILTYDDLLAAARKVKAADPSSGPIHLEHATFLAQLQLEMFASQQGTSLADANGKLRINSPGYQRILTFLNAVQKEKLGTRADYLGPTDIKTLDAGKQVFVPWAIWWDFAPQTLLKATKGDWRAMPLPAWTAGGARSGAMGGSSFVIPKQAKNAKLAWLFYRFLMFDKAGYSAVWGPNAVYPKGTNTSIPSYKPAADPNTPLFGNVDALGGQNLWKTATSAGAQIPGGAPTPKWWAQSVNYLGANLEKMLDGTLTPNQVLSQSTSQIQTNLVNRK